MELVKSLNLCVIWLIIPGIIFVNCVPVEYDVGSESYDLDTEQSEARYDPRLLSEELRGSHPESQQGAEACISSNQRYEHGQKISRNDPCEVCLCVDGEVFCWWKQCESTNQVMTASFKKQSSQKYGRKNHKSINTKTYSTNMNKTTVENYPKGILTFPLNLPLHLRSLDLNNSSIKPNHTEKIHLADSTIKTTSTVSPKLSNPLSGHIAESADSDKTMTTTTKSTTSAIKPVIKILDDIFMDDDVLTPIENKKQNQTKNNTLNNLNNSLNTMPTSYNDNVGDEDIDIGGYYEKTIINKDGIFIEDIHKIPTILNHNHFNSDEDDDGEVDDAQLKHIKIDDITSGQHYVITSSGNVENTDVLASDSVLSQFKNNFIDFTSVTTTTTMTPQHQQPTETTSSDISATFIMPTQLGREQMLAATGLNDNITKQNIVNIVNPINSFTASENNTKMQESISSSLSVTMTTVSSSSSSSSSSTPLDETTSSSLGQTTSTANQNCIVMGISYKIGTILPQETGNCLQCVCVEGATFSDPPRVTCNPHNCPPLILPDLFDTTGY